jgi:hypothetical protein
VETPVDDDGFELYDEVAWHLAADADTEAQPDTHNNNDYGYEEDEYEETIRAPVAPDRGYWGDDPADADTNQLPDEEVADELPEDQEENDTAGNLTEDGEVFGPMSEARWKRIDRVYEIENHHTLGHGITGGYEWHNMGGSGQCEYCEEIMWPYLLRCPECGLGLCRLCVHHVGNGTSRQARVYGKAVA